MMKKDIWEGRIKCPDCKRWMEKTKVLVDNIKMRAWKCPKCRNESLHPVDVERALIFYQMKKIAVKIGIMQQAPYVRFPKAMAPIMHKGDTMILEPTKDPDKYIVEIRHEHEQCSK